jgi:SnoaL-like domain
VTSLEELAAEVAELRRRVQAAEGALAVQQLKARYADLVDARYEGGGVVGPGRLAELAEAIADLFTPDAVWDGGPALGVAEGRDAVAARMRAPTLRFSRHLFLSPRIRVSGSRAEARWELLSPCTTADGIPRWLCGYEDDEYEQGEDGRWRHRRMALTTVFLARADEGWRTILSPKK